MARDERSGASRREARRANPARDVLARGGDGEERWLAAALHSIPDGVVYLDAQLIVRAANRAMCRLLERRPSSLIGRSLGDAARAIRDPGGQPYNLERRAARCIANYSSREVAPLRFEKRTGQTEPMSVTIMPYGRRHTAVRGCALYQRLCGSGALDPGKREELEQTYSGLNPLRLRRQIDTQLEKLWALAAPTIDQPGPPG